MDLEHRKSMENVQWNIGLLQEPFCASISAMEGTRRKIYFAGSIRGGRSDAELYGKLIEHIKKTSIVLTEHIGDLSLSLLEDERHDREIYLQDTAWLAECDIVIAECTTPSIGVGYELAYAQNLGKPCHILYRRSHTSLSAMVSGADYFELHPYETLQQALDAIDGILGNPIGGDDE